MGVFFYLQALSIEEDIGYPSYIKDPKKLAAKIQGVSCCRVMSFVPRE